MNDASESPKGYRFPKLVISHAVYLYQALYSTFAALLGFSAVGLGLSVVAPLVFRTAGTHLTIARGTVVAAVATMTYSGFLAGPPLLGWLAQISSFRIALTVVVVLSIMIVALSAVAQRQVRPLPEVQHN